MVLDRGRIQESEDRDIVKEGGSMPKRACPEYHTQVRLRMLIKIRIAADHFQLNVDFAVLLLQSYLEVQTDNSG